MTSLRAILDADPQLAQDAELGAAWREVEEVLPEGFVISLHRERGDVVARAAPWVRGWAFAMGTGPTATAALIALRDAFLEGRTK